MGGTEKVLVLLATMAAAAYAQGRTLEPQYEYGDRYKLFDIRSSLYLNCRTSEQPQPELEWLKDGTPVADDKVLAGRYELKREEGAIIVPRATEADGGNYTCVWGDLRGDIVAVAKPQARLPPNLSVVEGDTLKLTCVALGNPKPTVEWIIGNETYTTSHGRVTLGDNEGVANAILTMVDVVLEDRGNYHCRPKNIANDFVNITNDDFTFVRVKDSLAALWPFLGICAEVFVLCAIILIYEKRRSKPEMEESDTDQSPDQKHTPDHGKDRDIRHRK